jgi:hypothetical protein
MSIGSNQMEHFVTLDHVLFVRVKEPEHRLREFNSVLATIKVGATVLHGIQ